MLRGMKLATRQSVYILYRHPFMWPGIKGSQRVSIFNVSYSLTFVLMNVSKIISCYKRGKSEAARWRECVRDGHRIPDRWALIVPSRRFSSLIPP